MTLAYPALELAQQLAQIDHLAPPEHDAPSALDRVVAQIPPRELEALHYEWRAFWARADQLAPEGDDWDTWLILAGRGWGKTRSGAEYVRSQVEAGAVGRVAIVAATAADARDTIVEGESGILATATRWFRPIYEPSKRRITWPNGATALLFSAEEPDRLRGPQFGLGWADELAAWERLEETWNNLMFGLRLGDHPHAIVTTTPRPLALLRELRADARTRETRGSTYDNAANLAETYKRRIRRHEGTELGRQEIHGELLDDAQGLIFNASWFRRCDVEPQLLRVIVAIDPAVSTSRTADETGIVVVGLDASGNVYVLADLSGKFTPDAWAAVALKAFDDYAADAIVAETNRGGDLVEHTIATKLIATGRRKTEVSIKTVHASRGKATRAEPVAALYQQRRVFHVGQPEKFAKLERQMVDWDPTRTVSPDRIDALVWGVTFLDVEPDGRAAFDGLDEANKMIASEAAGLRDAGDFKAEGEPDAEDEWRPLTIG